jgi:predicted Fe-Mo cluster-binding NifX family protein
MKVAIPLFENRVSPRFDSTRDFLIVEIDNNRREVGRLVLSLEVGEALQIAERFAREGVDVVLSGGVDSEYQRELRLRNITVIWGLIGEAEDVLASYLEGQVFSGMGPCPTARKRGQPRHKKTGD